MKEVTNFIWKDRKRIFFGLPWSFTRYHLEEEKLIIDTGFFSRTEDEIRLYRITDLTLKRSLWERMFGLGTVHCCSGDQTSPEVDLKHIKNPKYVKNLISDMVEKQRNERRIGLREFLGDESEGGDNDAHEEN